MLQKMIGHQGMPSFKKDTYFPVDSVESTQPLLSKRRRLTKHDVGKCAVLCVTGGNLSLAW